MKKLTGVIICMTFMMLICLNPVLAASSDEYVPSPERVEEEDISEDSGIYSTEPVEDPSVVSGDSQYSPQTGEPFPYLWVILAVMLGTASIYFGYLWIHGNINSRSSKDIYDE